MHDKVLELREQGMTFREIQKVTGLKSTSTVSYHLKNDPLRQLIQRLRESDIGNEFYISVTSKTFKIKRIK
jgi:hypothetical protein